MGRYFSMSVVFVGFLLILLLSQTVLAVDVLDPSICEANSDPAICNVSEPEGNALVGPNGIITLISQWLVYISGALAVALIIIAGFMFIFSQGNPQSAGRARSTILYAIIGLVFVVIAQVIVTFVLNEIGK